VGESRGRPGAGLISMPELGFRRRGNRQSLLFVVQICKLSSGGCNMKAEKAVCETLCPSGAVTHCAVLTKVARFVRGFLDSRWSTLLW
jgi:hypothetical protein